MARKQTGLSLKLPDCLFGDINQPIFHWCMFHPENEFNGENRPV
jgi:hypothetical protein